MSKEEKALDSFIKENIGYDELRGVVFIKARPGMPAMRLPLDLDSEEGRRPVVTIMGRALLAAYVAWFVKTGAWPVYPIQHANKNPKDIRWKNMSSSKPGEEDDGSQEEMLAMLANDKFLADLRRFHPAGPPTYIVKSTGVPVLIRPCEIRSSSPAAMCAEVV